MEKAFDTVWHEAYKLNKIKTPITITNLIKSYLKGRKMFVSIKGSNSSIENVKTDVPQKSILGPTLFNIYTNDILTTDKTQLAIYADNIVIYSWNPNQATKYLQMHINMIIEYIHRWKLKINPKKTHAITFTRKNLQNNNQIINGYNAPWSWGMVPPKPSNT